ncbi:COX15/CtaA family protein, partial [Allosphingosinicella sp.]|uniref:COX15/CtaA family protein n=1 Tax=Allosphingosinicella sp. TaxID=2823234 RepID=UPI002F00F57C
MANPAVARPERPRALASWLLAVAALVFLMVVVGGITRLTESGLSIVRWEPLSGTLPPIGEEAWAAEFAAYKQSPQYQLVNSGMSLEDFKSIYFWEY